MQLIHLRHRPLAASGPHGPGGRAAGLDARSRSTKILGATFARELWLPLTRAVNYLDWAPGQRPTFASAGARAAMGV